ncbi:MAG: flagellar FliJ family protein [Burkholderiaceae bacterium]
MVARRVLDTLIELSGRHRDEAAGHAADARRASDQVQAMKRQLQQYRAEYDARSPVRAGQQTGPQQIERHLRFVARLDYAIGDQERRHEQARRVQAQREAELIERQKRLKAFETLKLRRDQADARRQERHEQRLTDEQATRIHQRRTRT